MADIHEDIDDYVQGGFYRARTRDWLFWAPGREVSLAAPANLGIVCTLPKSYCRFIQVMILAIFIRGTVLQA